jgi:hypothetical protein
MLLVKLHAVLGNLDEIALGKARGVDLDDVETAEAARPPSDEQGGEE